MNKALFLDRDGVDYLYKIEDFEFIDGIFETCMYFQKKGYLIIIITNQAGISMGKYTEGDYQLLTNWMIKESLKKKILRFQQCIIVHIIQILVVSVSVENQNQR